MAAARVRLLDIGFLLVLAAAAAAAEITQVIAAILLLGLLAAPSGAATRLTSRPWRAAVLLVVIALGSVWVGFALSVAQA